MQHASWKETLKRQLVPNAGTLIVVALMLWATQAGAAPWSAPGPSSTTVNYQGRLADGSGNTLTGTYGMQFAIYSASSGGSPVWGPESHAAVPVSNGLFSVGLGSQTSGGIPTTVWTDGDRYLEIIVDGETLTPRELIRSVPIAGLALTVPTSSIGSSQLQDGSVMSDKLADGSVTGDKLADGSVTGDKLADGTVTSRKIAPTILYKLGENSTTEISTNFTSWQAFNSPQLNFSTGVKSQVMIIAQIALQNGSAVSNQVIYPRIVVDGVALNTMEMDIRFFDKAERDIYTLTGVANVDIGSHTVTLESKSSDGTYVQRNRDTSILVIPFAR